MGNGNKSTGGLPDPTDALGSSIIGGTMAAVPGLYGQGMANSANKQMANDMMGFQSQMSNTAYQRAVQDMRAAGLNPAMMYGSGGAESTPSGAMGTAQNTLAGAATSAMDVMNSVNSLKTAQTQQGLNVANANAANASALNSLNSAAKTAVETKNITSTGAEDEFLGRFFNMGNKVMNYIGVPSVGSSAKPNSQLIKRVVQPNVDPTPVEADPFSPGAGNSYGGGSVDTP